MSQRPGLFVVDVKQLEPCGNSNNRRPDGLNASYEDFIFCLLKKKGSRSEIGGMCRSILMYIGERILYTERTENQISSTEI